jgi:acetoin utilization deacetylase AcuC-like enzyme
METREFEMTTKTAIMKSELFLEHDPGYAHVESPDRLEAIYSGLAEIEDNDSFIFPELEAASHDHLELVHTAEHVRRISETAGQGFVSLDPDTGASSQSYEAAALAAGAVVQGVKMLVDGEVDNVFALVRPPGHHAEADRAMGFCLFNNVAVGAAYALEELGLERVMIIFNNVAVGAAYALEELGLERVMIIDWDLHHGNGTQHSFYETDQVLYFSSHMYPYYPGSGALQELGSGRGTGYTVNIPLSGGVNDQAYAAIFNDIVAPITHQYKPELIMISAGYDIYVGDPLGTMAVTPPGFAYMARVLKKLAGEVCDGRLLLTLEGGYNLEGLREGVLATLGELSGQALQSDIVDQVDDLADASFGRPGCLPSESLDVLRRAFSGYWEI